LPSLKVIVEVRAIGLFFPFLSLSLSLSFKKKKKKGKKNEVKSLYGQVLIL